MTAEGLSAVLEKNPRFKVIGLSPNGEHLLHLLNGVTPDIVLLDLNMPVMDGITACKAIRKRYPNIIVIALTMYSNTKTLKEVKDAGAAGMLHKFTSAAELIEKLEEILLNTNPSTFITNSNCPSAENVPLRNDEDEFMLKYKISKREFEIIRLVAEGKGTDEIAQILFLSSYTITTHRRNILNKLNLKNAAELIHLMHKNGFL
jgi:DNA-binding NarL/FixJ family response regulator